MKKALLVVSFGTSVPRARREIEAVEQALAAQAPDRTFFRAYTSPTIGAFWHSGESRFSI